MKKLSSAILLCICTLTFHSVKAQLFVDTAYTVEQMMEDFFDSTGVTISNITYSGVNQSVGFFDAGSTNLGINAGIMLTSGTVYNAVGPNLQSGITSSNNAPGDPDLDQLAGFPTYDASVIEFDIVPTSDTLFFKYVFGSDEYTEWVNSSYNDVFAFFLTGPGYADSNIAAIPGTNTAVAINSVNCLGAYGNYYVCNDPMDFSCGGGYSCPSDPYSTTIEYDGFTTPLPIHAIVQPNSSYHVKIAVGDAGDGILDSGVFLSIESLGGNDSLACEAYYSKESNGNNVSFLDQSLYASHWYWDFGDGTFSTERNPVHTYNDLATTSYIVKQKVWNFCCADSMVFGVGNFLGVQELMNQPISIGPNPVSGSLSIQLNQETGGELFLYDFTGKLLMTQRISGDLQLDLSSLISGTYLLEYADGKQVYHQKVLKL